MIIGLIIIGVVGVYLLAYSIGYAYQNGKLGALRRAYRKMNPGKYKGEKV